MIMKTVNANGNQGVLTQLIFRSSPRQIFVSKYLVELVGVACLVSLVLIIMFDAKVLTTIIAMPICNCRTRNTHSYRVVKIIIMSISI